MKFYLTFLTYLIIGVVLGCGIFAIVKGSYWLFAVGLIAYLLLFSKFGCLPPKSHHDSHH